MMQDRMKNIFWLWLFKSIQPSLAGRRGFLEADDPRIFAKLGRFQLSRESTWQRPEHRRLSAITTATHGLTLPAATVQLDDEVWLEPQTIVRPVSISGGIFQNKLSKPSVNNQKEEYVTQNRELSIRLTRPIIPVNAWEEMTGFEWEQEEMVDALAQSGLELCVREENPWIDWKAHKDTEKILQDKDAMLAMDEGEVLVYVGKAKQEGHATNLPIIKTKSILPLSAQEMAELLMDSARVQIYNKMSLGREDVRIYNENTKIVCNLTKPPIAKSKMVSVTLMHSRELTEENQALLGKYTHGYLVVSRAVPGMVAPDLQDLTRNDILLGVNLLQELGPNECLMTAVTHVYSPALPTMLAKSMGVSSAVNFVTDIRTACQPVAN